PRGAARPARCNRRGGMRRLLLATCFAVAAGCGGSTNNNEIPYTPPPPPPPTPDMGPVTPPDPPLGSGETRLSKDAGVKPLGVDRSRNAVWMVTDAGGGGAVWSVSLDYAH